PMTPSDRELTTSADALQRYDMVVFECEGGEVMKAAGAQQNVLQYANAGGRLFFTHYSYTWLYNVMPFAGMSAWVLGCPRPTHNDGPLTSDVDQSFPKGMALAAWLRQVGAISPVAGVLDITAPRHDVDAVNPPAQRWIYSQSPATVQHFT